MTYHDTSSLFPAPLYENSDHYRPVVSLVNHDSKGQQPMQEKTYKS